MIAGPERALALVKAVHTVAWAFFASSIIAIPLFAMRGSYGVVVILAAIVMIEVLVLLANAWKCPLTAVAARFTEDRSDNFDIYLPEWLARHNKLIFGWLFIAGLAFSFLRWLEWFR